MRSILILALILMKTALFADFWSSPQVVDKSSNEPAIAVGMQGNAVSVCVHTDGVNSWIDASTQIQGGAWSAPVAISPSYQNGCYIPSVAIDKNGNAVAVWIGVNQDNLRQVEGATYSVQSNTWTATEPLSILAASVGCNLELALDRQGNALAIWTLEGGNNDDDTIQSTRLKFGEQSWTAVASIQASHQVFWLDMASDPRGNAWLIWIDGNGLQTATLAFGDQAWGNAQVLSQNGDTRPLIAVSSQGNALALWREPIAADGDYAIRAATCAYGSTTWQQTQFSQDLIGLSYVLWIGFDGVGNAYLVSSANILQMNVAPMYFSKLPFKSNTWTPPLSIGPVGDYVRDGCAGVDQAGNLVAIWEAGGIIKASTLPANSANGWTTAVQLATASFAPGGMPTCGLSSQKSCTLIYTDAADGNVKTITGSQLFQSPSFKRVKKGRRFE